MHPNLARLAAAYDDVMERFARHQLTAQQARDQILALVARDDNGVLWSISPDTGRWLYRNSRNELVEATPPAYGYASLTAHDLSITSDAFNPDSRIGMFEVDDSMLNAPGSLAGSTRVSHRPTPPFAKLLLVATVLAVLAGSLFLLL